MRVIRGTVVGGEVVVDEPLAEGAVVTVLVPDDDEVLLSDLDRAELRASMAGDRAR